MLSSLVPLMCMGQLLAVPVVESDFYKYKESIKTFRSGKKITIGRGLRRHVLHDNYYIEADHGAIHRSTSFFQNKNN